MSDIHASSWQAKNWAGIAGDVEIYRKKSVFPVKSLALFVSNAANIYCGDLAWDD